MDDNIYQVLYTTSTMEMVFCRQIEFSYSFVVLKKIIVDKQILYNYEFKNDYLTLLNINNKRFIRLDEVHVPTQHIIEIIKVPKRKNNIVQLFP